MDVYVYIYICIYNIDNEFVLTQKVDSTDEEVSMERGDPEPARGAHAHHSLEALRDGREGLVSMHLYQVKGLINPRIPLGVNTLTSG